MLYEKWDGKDPDIFYELFNCIEAYSKWLERNKKQSKVIIIPRQNFAHYIKIIAKARFYQNKSRSFLQTKQQEIYNLQHIRYKEWLLEKINDLFKTIPPLS